MRRRAPSRRELLRRIESIEERLALPVPEPLAGQQTIPVATIRDHPYAGPGPCRVETFAVRCGQHRDAHHHTGGSGPS
ncbi:hypothetical protein [Streptomyces alfalfae]|uniref:hypothetical protein n=1 Tax=Streptomyces alfalfae TaxID=1642299 RepID=UPI0028123F5D|nr:hypothetical protein [Streptomyces alfalfae]